MPKISAPTVAEHREYVLGALVDAAEAILRKGEPLTAGAVSAGAGIARNSIYRYVASVDDLRGLVLARHLPAWGQTVAAAAGAVEDPAEQIVEWVRANLEQAQRAGHGWLMSVAKDAPPSEVMSAASHHTHDGLVTSLREPWARLSPSKEAAETGEGLTISLMHAGFDQLDKGGDPATVIAMTVAAARGLVEGAAARR